jgi:hypothetical protein
MFPIDALSACKKINKIKIGVHLGNSVSIGIK